jgi:RNA polymerase sigma factor (sigma-70 family)
MDSITQLVTAAQTADPPEKRRLFNALAAHFQPVALAWARRILPDADSAEDAVQEALLIAYQQIGSLREPAAFPAWLKRIVVSQCARARRRGQHQSLDEEWAGDPESDPAAQADARWAAAKLHQAVERLNATERAVTQLYYLDAYSQQEIATLLQLPLTTVKKRLQYAREHLRERLPTLSALAMPGDGAALPLLEPDPWNAWALGYAAVLGAADDAMECLA